MAAAAAAGGGGSGWWGVGTGDGSGGDESGEKRDGVCWFGCFVRKSKMGIRGKRNPTEAS